MMEKHELICRWLGRMTAPLLSGAILVISTASEPAPTRVLPLSDSERNRLEVSLSTPDSTDALTEWKAPLLLPEPDGDAEDSYEYTDLARRMSDFADNYLGVRYRLGATGPKSFDCSGFIKHIYNNFGLEVNRTSRQQYRQGDKIELDEVKPGDLLFFSGRRVSKTVGHVGMVVSVDPITGEVEMIHASSSQGIARQKFPDNGYFSRRFIGARRLLGTEGFTDAHPKT